MDGAEEPFEEVFLLVKRNSHALVLDLDDALATVGQDPNTDGPTVGRVLDGIGDEVVHSLPEPAGVADHPD